MCCVPTVAARLLATRRWIPGVCKQMLQQPPMQLLISGPRQDDAAEEQRADGTSARVMKRAGTVSWDTL